MHTGSTDGGGSFQFFDLEYIYIFLPTDIGSDFWTNIAIPLVLKLAL